MEARLSTGQTVSVCDEVEIRTKPMRFWGNRVRQDTKAPDIYLPAKILSITFEMDDYGQLIWHGTALVTHELHDAPAAFIQTAPGQPYTTMEIEFINQDNIRMKGEPA